MFLHTSIHIVQDRDVSPHVRPTLLRRARPTSDKALSTPARDRPTLLHAARSTPAASTRDEKEDAAHAGAMVVHRPAPTAAPTDTMVAGVVVEQTAATSAYRLVC